MNAGFVELDLGLVNAQYYASELGALEYDAIANPCHLKIV